MPVSLLRVGGIAAALMVAAPVVAADAVTPVDFDACEVTEFEMGADLVCEGFGGVALHLTDFDGRVSLGFGSEADVNATFSAFNNVTGAIEWYLGAAGRPAAAVARYVLSIPDGAGFIHPEVLVVYAIPEGAPSCPVGVVDHSNADPDGLAADAARKAAAAPDCSRPPLILGASDEFAAGFSGAERRGQP